MSRRARAAGGVDGCAGERATSFASLVHDPGEEHQRARSAIPANRLAFEAERFLAP